MSMMIDGIDFQELEAEKYWSFAKSFKGDPKEETRNMIFSGNYIGARKMDGAYYRFIKDIQRLLPAPAAQRPYDRGGSFRQGIRRGLLP